MKKLRFGLIALAVMVSVGGAFATKSNVKARIGLTTYGVVSQDASNYYVSLSDPDAGKCVDGDNACEITTNTAPTGPMNAIPLSDASQLGDNGTFEPGN